MAADIDIGGLQALLTKGAQLIEVLPSGDYDEEHLPGALNIPLGQLCEDSVAGLERAAATVVYGFDYQCDLSPRAARFLDDLGFRDVYDFVPGKVAWLAEGLASEGDRRPEQRVGSIADADVVAILAGATVGEAKELLASNDVGVVLDADDIVAGLLRREVTGLGPSTKVRDVLQPGPSTFRPSMTIREMVDYFRSSDETRAIISTLEGRWIGLIPRSAVIDD